jgi:hypothetical protein
MAGDAELVRLLDLALKEAKALQARYEREGKDPEFARRAVVVLENEKADAQAGRVGSYDEGYGFAPTRFLGEYDWGPEAKAMIDAAYAAQEYWAENM